MKKLLIILGVIILSFGLFALPSIYVLANNQCNIHNPSNCPSPTPICDNGEHTGNPHCHTPSSTPHPTTSPTSIPTASASATPLPTATPCLIWEGEFEVPCATPTDTPLETPIDITAGIIPPAAGVAPTCSDGSVKYAPTLTVFNRTSSDTVHLEWTTTDTNQFIVYYGLVNSGQFPWNTGPFIGQSIDLHQVPNESINIKVCSVGSCGEELCGAIIDP